MRLLIIVLVGIAGFLHPAIGRAQPPEASPSAPSAADICPNGSATPEATPATIDGTPVETEAIDADVVFIDALRPGVDGAIDLSTVIADRTDRPEMIDFASGAASFFSGASDELAGMRFAIAPGTPELTDEQIVGEMTRILSVSPGMGGAPNLEG